MQINENIFVPMKSFVGDVTGLLQLQTLIASDSIVEYQRCLLIKSNSWEHPLIESQLKHIQ